MPNPDPNTPMTLDAAEKLARRLMDRHGLQDWLFAWDDAVKRFGYCYYYRKCITLSRVLTPLQSREHVTNTILHEIAHALVGYQGSHHGPEWQAMARKLGATPKATVPGVGVSYRYVGMCPSCGRTIRRHRRLNRACGRCCTAHADGEFDQRFAFVWSEASD